MALIDFIESFKTSGSVHNDGKRDIFITHEPVAFVMQFVISNSYSKHNLTVLLIMSCDKPDKQ